MEEPSIYIRSIGFEPDGVIFEFALKTESRDGMIMNRTLLVPENDEYEETIAELKSFAEGLLEEALSDFAFTPTNG